VWDRRELSKQAIAAHQQALWQLKCASVWEKHKQRSRTHGAVDFALSEVDDLVDLTEEEEKLAQHHEAQAEIHERKLVEIEQKLQQLRTEQEMCRQLLKRLSLRFTEPSDEEGWQPAHKYSLRGVATNTDTTYVRRKAETDLIEIEGRAAPEDQWWKLAFVSQDPEPVKVEKTTCEEAIKAAYTETDKPILIYANDRAMNEDPIPLPESLQTFVRFDNRLFKQELIEESPKEKKRASNDLPASPPKRHQREGSMDSMATNRASTGDISDRDEDFMDMVNGEQEGREHALGSSGGEERGEESGVGDGAAEGKVDDPGTEMVQLAIRKPAAMAGEERGLQDGVEPVADWDNPEGRLMPKTEYDW